MSASNYLTESINLVKLKNLVSRPIIVNFLFRTSHKL